MKPTISSGCGWKHSTSHTLEPSNSLDPSTSSSDGKYGSTLPLPWTEEMSSMSYTLLSLGDGLQDLSLDKTISWTVCITELCTTQDHTSTLLFKSSETVMFASKEPLTCGLFNFLQAFQTLSHHAGLRSSLMLSITTQLLSAATIQHLTTWPISMFPSLKTIPPQSSTISALMFKQNNYLICFDLSF